MRTQNHRRGSALLLTLLVVSLLLALVLSFLVVVRLNFRTQNQRVKKVQAQQNARVALQIALGELQKSTGPDQRITAPADLVADTDSGGAATSAFNGIHVQPGMRYWTGVWANRNPDISYALTPDQIGADDTVPALLNWLVSGNESTRYQQLSGGGAVPVTVSRFSPVTTIQGFDAGSDAFSRPRFSSGSGDVDGVVLVGPHTVSDSSPAHAQQSFDRGNYVVAPLVDMEAGGQVRGRYAWWVGDEGVKARANLQNLYQQTGDIDDQFSAFLVSQRDAVEFVDDADGVRLGSVAYDFTNSSILRLSFRKDLSFLQGAPERLSRAAKARFHDLSLHNAGVLTDTYAGGLRKNLTADILDTSSDHSYRPADSDPIFPLISNTSNEPLMPTWGVLRSWARTGPDSSGRIEPIVASETNAVIAPVMTSASLGLNYYLEGPEDTFVMALFPMVVLFNPYPYTLKATNYDIAIRVNGNSRIFVRVDPDGAAGASGYSNVAVFNLETASIYAHGTTLPPDSYFRFPVQGSDIPPGESHIYLLPDAAHATEYDPVNGPPLERAPNADNIGIGNFVKLTGPDLASSGLTTQPDAIIQLQSTDMRVNSNRFYSSTEIDFVLAEQGTLTPDLNPADANSWFQTVTNTLGRNCATVSQTFCDTDTTYSEVNNRRALGGVPPFTHATSALRLTAYTEMLDTWLAHDRWGFGPTKFRLHVSNNFRAPFIAPTVYERQNQTDGRVRAGAVVMGAGLIGADSYTNKTDNPHINFTNQRHTMNYGQSLNASEIPNRPEVLHQSIFFDLLATPDHFRSLGQLQNAPFSRYAFQPAYPFGNSYADPRIQRDRTYRDGIIIPLDGGPGFLPAYDLSWLMNRSLWDRYFLAGVPEGWTQNDLDNNRPLPNSRMKLIRPGGDVPDIDSIKSGRNAYEKAAAHLLVTGSFNINSTSEQAWRAVLAGAYGIPAADADAYAEANDHVDVIIPFPRFTHNIADAVQANEPYPEVTGTMVAESPLTRASFYESAFLGNRGLYLHQPAEMIENASPEAVVTELARSIVAEIRKRGPFLSLADFINRPLTASDNIQGVKGALQAGIDGMNFDAAQANPYTWTRRDGAGTLLLPLANPSSFGNPVDWDPEHTLGGPESDFGTSADPYQMQLAMAPFFLTQADILSSLGPRISARSDTFLIRTYGEVVNPVNGEIESRAWCEAVVQRLPEYVDESESPEEVPTGINFFMGRRYEVLSFRWLLPENI